MVVFSTFAAVTLLASLATAFTGLYVFVEQDGPGSTAFVVTMAGTSLYAGSYGLNLLTFDPAASELLEGPFWLAGELLTVGFLFFALAFTGRDRYLTYRNGVIVSLVPAVTVLVAVTNSVGLHELFWSNYTVVETFGAGVRTFDRGPWLYVKSTYAFVLMGAGLLMFLEEIYVEQSLYRNQSIAIMVAVLFPLSGYNAWLLKLGPYPQVDFTAPLLFFSAFCYLYAIVVGDLFEASPAVRRIGKQHTVDSFTDAVVIVDDAGIVTDLNDAAETVLDCRRVDALGRHVNDLADETRLDLDAETQSASIQTATGWRQFEVTVGTMRGGDGQDIGHTVVFHDVTDQRRRKQRLEVLNRILRHNLRNDTSAIVGFAEAIEDETDEATTKQYAARISDTAENLVDIGEKARELEDAIEGDIDREHVDLRPLLADLVAEQRRTTPAATIDVTGAEGATVYSNPVLLRLAFSNLIENGIEHNDSDHPQVALRLEDADEEYLAVSVADDGPGIPAHELETLRAGNEEALQHGQGIGLWIVQWCISTVGGRVAFEADDTGSRITVWLPTTDDVTVDAGDESDTAGLERPSPAPPAAFPADGSSTRK